jgi:hypothetical protein
MVIKILFVGVFDNDRASTNTSQLLSFKRIGCDVVGYNYRKRTSEIGTQARDLEIINTVKQRSFDLVIYSKCNDVSEEVFIENSKAAITCLWFMDPLITYNEEMRLKTGLVDFFCCDKENVLNEAKNINPNSFHVCEGFDEDVDKPIFAEKCHNVSFIGNLYGQREALLKNIEEPVKIFNGAYGKEHAVAVSSTKINLNFCTSGGASDRVYKILAAGGFLITNDWAGREKHFEDGEELVIFKTIEDLNSKITFYLNNPQEREGIAKNALKKIQKFNRKNWAINIIKRYEQIK